MPKSLLSKVKKEAKKAVKFVKDKKLVSKAVELGKKGLKVARKHKLLSKAIEVGVVPEEYVDVAKKVATVTGTGKKRGQTAERMAELRAMRGKGVGKKIVKGLKKANKFLKKTGIVSKALALTGNPEFAAPVAMLGYGEEKKMDTADVKRSKNVRKVKGMNQPLDAPVNSIKRGGRKQKGGDINSGVRSMVSDSMNLMAPAVPMGSQLNRSLNQDDVNSLGSATGFFTNPILSGSSSAFNPNPDDLYNRVQSQGGKYIGGGYNVNPFNQSRNSVASLYEARESLSDVNVLPLRR